MQRFGSLWKLCEIAIFERLREGFEAAPDRSRPEFAVPRLAPLMERREDETIAAHPDIRCTNHEVVGLRVIDLALPPSPKLRLERTRSLD